VFVRQRPRAALQAAAQAVLSVALAAAGASCGGDATDDTAPSSAAASGAAGNTAPVRVATSRAAEQRIARFIRVTGTLTAQEQADVAAEIAGRIVATPVERGSVVSTGSRLVSIAATEVEAQSVEAEANLAQIQARLGQPVGPAFDIERVPEVASAGSSQDLARADFERVRTLHERKLVSQAEFDQRRAQADNAARQYQSARNAAEQQLQALASARARVTLARKAVADTVVRAPFPGVVGERLVSVGDYVTRGTKVASVMRVNPLRVELTVPAQQMAAVAIGRSVSLEVDAYPGKTFNGTVRYVSPQVRAESRSLLVEAVVPNDAGMLKPGLFVTAQIEGASPTPGVMVPAAAVQTASGTSRVFVVAGDHVEERIITVGESIGLLVEATTGLAAGDVVATSNLTLLADGTRVVTP
jgi:multidrug efflux pump subunit AcrA (membrane-fusion protein)